MLPLAVPAEPDAFTRLDFSDVFDREFAYVWTTLRRLGVAERDLEDVAHEVFLQVHKHWAAYDPARAMRPWLFGFAYRLAADYRRLARHRVSLVGDVNTLDVARDNAHLADEQLIAHEATKLVHRALDHLDFDQRAVLVLHDLDGCSMQSVATTLSIPVNTGYSRLRLARARFTTVVRRLQLQEDKQS